VPIGNKLVNSLPGSGSIDCLPFQWEGMWRKDSVNVWGRARIKNINLKGGTKRVNGEGGRKEKFNGIKDGSSHQCLCNKK